MEPVEYEIQYTVAATNQAHTFTYHVYNSSKSAKDEIERIKAITRALLVSKEFRYVKLVRKRIIDEMVEL